MSSAPKFAQSRSDTMSSAPKYAQSMSDTLSSAPKYAQNMLGCAAQKFARYDILLTEREQHKSFSLEISLPIMSKQPSHHSGVWKESKH